MCVTVFENVYIFFFNTIVLNKLSKAIYAFL